MKRQKDWKARQNFLLRQSNQLVKAMVCNISFTYDSIIYKALKDQRRHLRISRIINRQLNRRKY